MAAGVQLLLPGLFDLPLHELEPGLLSDGLSNLNRILGLAQTRANQDYSIDAMLARALMPESTATTAGLAMAEAFAETAAISQVSDAWPAERLMLLKAIHLQADMNGAIAVPIPETDENLADIDKIINDLSELFEEDCEITPIFEGVYLLRLKQFDPPTHYPHPLSVLGRGVNAFIEQSRQVLPWYRLINEFQMFMHQHPLNARRLGQGKLIINSLWAWGSGALPVLTRQPAWYCDDALLNQFAGRLDLPLSGTADLHADANLQHALVVDLRLLQELKSGEVSALDKLLLDIDTNLLAPILQSIKRRSARLVLRAGYRFDFELRPRAGLRFWRRPGSLQDWQ